MYIVYADYKGDVYFCGRCGSVESLDFKIIMSNNPIDKISCGYKHFLIYDQK